MDIETLAQDIRDRARTVPRLLVAIAGPPASGKSTLAEALAAKLGPRAAVLPMDGFHLDNAQLEQMGLLHRKGAPQTFDAEGFVALIGQLRGEGAVPYPTFDRTQDCTVPGGGMIDADTQIVLVEGNYVLLDLPPWAALAGAFDMTVAIDVDLAELERRLIARWRAHGLDAAAAGARARGNDLKNATMVVQRSRAADVTLRPGT